MSRSMRTSAPIQTPTETRTGFVGSIRPSGLKSARIGGAVNSQRFNRNLRNSRREFWQTFPDVPKRRITHYSGNGKMWPTDTRCAFVEYVDALSKGGDISEQLADRATL